VNLLYVAATRAKKRLRINSELHRLMSYAAARSVQPSAPVPKLAQPLLPPPTRKPIPKATSSSLLPPRKLRPAPPASILDGLDEEVEHSKRYGRPRRFKHWR
jgi:ATP-dependent exoDNAse (exonuclease V) beta subunit